MLVLVYIISTRKGIISSHPEIDGDILVPPYLPDDYLFDPPTRLEYAPLTHSEKRQIKKAQQILKFISPLYNVKDSFWANFRNGPRPLTQQEENILSELNPKTKKTKIFNKEINSPIGIASGPAPNSKFLKLYSELGHDILTTKTVRLYEYDGHPKPNIIYVDGGFLSGFQYAEKFTDSITNYFGIPSLKYGKWVKDFKEFKNQMPSDKLFIVSVTATPKKGMNKEKSKKDIVDQFVKLSEIVKNKVNADAVELNFSCPSVRSKEGVIYKDPEFSKQIIRSVRLKIGYSYPLLIKIGYTHKIDELIYKIGSHVSGIVALNAIPSEIIYPMQYNGAQIERAGICGRALYKPSLDFLKQLIEARKIYGDHFEITGVGGISPQTIKDFLELELDAYTMATDPLFSPFSAYLCKEQMT